MKKFIYAALLLVLVIASIPASQSWSDSRKGGTRSDPLPPDMLHDDIMPPPDHAETSVAPVSPEDSHSVIPILFVPNDITPNPHAVDLIDKNMRLIQRWYAEQLRGYTFTLEQTQIVVGANPLAHYYGACFPPQLGCNWGYTVWDRIMSELPSLGYPWQEDQIHGVFFQNEGFGAPALGGGNRFLVGVDTDNLVLIEDCAVQGCDSMINIGGAAHELGHALGLPHTFDDPEGSPERSVMSVGFYNFPRATFVNTTTNPERDVLYNSPFITIMPDLQDSGFEACLDSWEIVSGVPTCPTFLHRSGLIGINFFSDSGGTLEIGQDVGIVGGRTYDVSGWLNISSSTTSVALTVEVASANATGTVISSAEVATLTMQTDGWERFAGSIEMPPEAVSARVIIRASGLNGSITIDDISFQEAVETPSTPLPIFYFDGDAIATQSPTLQWSDVTSATSYRFQLSANPDFSTLVEDATTTSPFYTVQDLLSFDTTYFWRVKAMNGAGESDWSLPWRFIPRNAENYHSDEFEDNTMASGWTWIRESPGSWWLGGPLGRRNEGYLGINALAGDLYTQNNVANLLMRPVPGDWFDIVTDVHLSQPSSGSSQQGGLLIYQDDDNYVQLMRVFDEMGYKFEVKAELEGIETYAAEARLWGGVPIKLSRRGNAYTAWYSPDGLNWNPIGEPIVANFSFPQIGLAAYDPLAGEQITAFFERFRVSTFTPVTADFVAAPTSGNAPLTIDFTNLSTGNFDTCAWSFGDGSTSNDCDNPEHVYTSSGGYTVTLTVAGAGGEDSLTRSEYITVTDSVNAQFSGVPTSGVAPLTVNFTNQSSGDYEDCTWSYGDGNESTSCQGISHIYHAAGTYTVTLDISGAGGSDTATEPDYIEVLEPGSVNFSASPTSGIAPLTVNFSNLSSGEYDTCSWEFGDGATSTECVDPNHTYSVPGVYTVTLTASGADGTDSLARANYISVYEPVTAEFSASPTSGPAPLVVSFTNLSSGDFTNCEWNFGEGDTESSCGNPVHTYSASGIYTVVLEVSGPGGNGTMSKTDYIVVDDAEGGDNLLFLPMIRRDAPNQAIQKRHVVESQIRMHQMDE